MIPYVDEGVRFSLRNMTVRELYVLRKALLSITAMLWVRQKPKYDEILNEWYIPRTPILIYLN
jgi:hypothetical protein